MHSLFSRIFMLFWVSMALIVVGSIAITYAVATREYEAQELQRRPSLAIPASEVLEAQGLDGLVRWLAANKNAIPDRDFFIIGPGGADILGRRLTEPAARRLEFINREGAGSPDARPLGPDLGAPGGPGPPGTPRNFRPPRQAPQIVGPDGITYTILLVPRRPSLFGALALPGIPLAVLAIALIVSALASWWLAQHLSAPIRRIQEGARSVATEQLDVRVSAGLDGRRDELAVLARDFDAMADRLRATRAARTQLLRDISHELRSPLARMRVAIGIARQPASDPTRQLDRLEREIERLDAMISQVLRLARLNSEDLNFKREPVDIDEVVESVVRDAAFEGAAKSVSVRLTGSADVRLEGSRELLCSAIENVLRNAVRYSPAGTAVDVAVRATARDVEIVVADEGPGVPAGELEQIFEPFYRVAEARDRDSGGEGIGLAITAQVMRAHGGSASARNRTARGLEVRLTLARPVDAPPNALTLRTSIETLGEVT
jgi:two-component system sensor histidine kinase CpxA